jgi:hypothetical protein
VLASKALNAPVLRSRSVPIYKVAFGEALALEPRFAAPATIARVGELRDDSLKPMLRTGAKECSTVAAKFIAELEWTRAASPN